MKQMGGAANVQSFYKLYLVPGIGHGTWNGTSNPNTNPPSVPWGHFYKLLVDWVEKGIEPDRIDLETPPGAPIHISQPICPYPQEVRYVGGDPRVASSYECS
jgi:feruloyl esterase